MHADIHGAASVVIKNIDSKPVPQRTLEEAAVFTICRSKAWESKVKMNINSFSQKYLTYLYNFLFTHQHYHLIQTVTTS